MKITKETFSIFKNFVTIHPSLIVKEKQSIVTMSQARNIIAIYDPPEEFPTFGIYQLHEFLSAVSLFKLDETDFLFKDKFLQIKYKNNAIKYIFTDIDLIEYYEAVSNLERIKKIKSFDKFNSKLELSQSGIERIKKSANILFSGEEFKNVNVKIFAENGVAKVKVQNEDSIMSNKFNMIIKDVEGDCSITFNVDYLVMLKGDYTLDILDKKLIKFTHKTLPLTYFITPRAF